MRRILSNTWHEILRFDEGEDIVAGILGFARENKIEAAWLSAIGSAKEIELGFYDLEKKKYLDKTFKKPLEVVEASGTISVLDSKPALHLHGVFSDENYQTLGGHIHKLVANATVEVFIHKLGESGSARLERKRDPETGLNLLD
ncbi:MAG: DNA-binding protein [Candidatus Brennerbacteria bacterium]|nr:DNA-binding protein [Candidatus Brennerbacteria bacterium]